MRYGSSRLDVHTGACPGPTHSPLLLTALLAALAIAALLVWLPARARAAGTDECGSSHAGWVFCTGFEEGNLNLWDDYDGNPSTTNTLMLDPGPANLTGNHVMRLRAPAGSGVADLVKVLPQGYDRLYARWYVKWEPGYDFTALNHGSGLHAGSRDLLGHSGDRPNGSDWFSAFLEPSTTDRRIFAYSYSRGMYQDCTDPSGSCWGDRIPCLLDQGQMYCLKTQDRQSGPLPQMQTGRWYCIEMMMDGGTPTSTAAGANGVLDYWIDGQEIGPWNGLWLRTTSGLKLDVLWLALFFHSTHSVQGIMLDDVAISTQRIGPRGGTAITGVEDTPVSVGYVLRPNVPNPFNPQTTLSFELPAAESIRLAVYDAQGRLVRELVNGRREAGRHTVNWDGTDAAGRSLASGTYLARLEAGGRTLIDRMSLVR